MSLQKKIILYIAASLDGYIAREDGSVDWLDSSVDFGDYKFDLFLQNIGEILIGRKTYVQSLGFGDWYFKNQDTYVFSRSTTPIASARTRLVQSDPVEFARELRSQPGKDIWLLGGGDLNHQFLESEMIDEIILCLQPVCLGHGVGLFGERPLTELKTFRLERAVPFSNGSVILHYLRN